MRLRKLFLSRRWKHMRAVHPHFRLVPDAEPPGGWRILWRNEEIGRTEPLHALPRPSTSDCFIVATGPSLADQDLSGLKHRPSIGVNGSIVKAEEAGFTFDYYVIVDRKFVADRFDLVERVLQSPAYCLLSFRVLSEICARRPELLARDRLFLISEMNAAYGVERMHPAEFATWAAGAEHLLLPDWSHLHPVARTHPHRVGFSKRLESGVFTAQTVAFVALQVAYALGSRRIFLLGVDLGGGGSLRRFYEHGVSAPSRLDRDLAPFILPSFELAGRLRASEGFAVFNLSPSSLLPEHAIPTLSLDAALALDAAGAPAPAAVHAPAPAPAPRPLPEADGTLIRVFVGAHAHEVLPLQVLQYSIARHTRHAVSVQTVDNSLATPPADARFAAYTRFSFGRFAIPRLTGYRGRAIYLDSDMLVLADIAELWNTPFAGAKILVEKFTSRSRPKGRFTAVMLMDCATLRWDPDEIVARLGTRYDYEELMSIYPLLAAGELQDRLPLGWNSMDRRYAYTRLVHYTRVRTQPWVYPCHPLGPLWVGELRRMLAEGVLTADFVRAEVACGHLRPSLLAELGLDDRHAGQALLPRTLLALDREAGFVLHAELLHERGQRDTARGHAPRPGPRRWRTFRRHPIRVLLNRT